MGQTPLIGAIVRLQINSSCYSYLTYISLPVPSGRYLQVFGLPLGIVLFFLMRKCTIPRSPVEFGFKKVEEHLCGKNRAKMAKKRKFTIFR